MSRRIQIHIDSDVRDVALASISVRALCRHFSLCADLSYKIELCVDEMLNNVISHGFNNEKGNSIQIRFRFDEAQLRITIVDQAKPMALKGPPSLPHRNQALKDLPERGYGRFLVHEIMDEVRYESKKGFNHLVMIKTLREADFEKCS